MSFSNYTRDFTRSPSCQSYNTDNHSYISQQITAHFLDHKRSISLYELATLDKIPRLIYCVQLFRYQKYSVFSADHVSDNIHAHRYSFAVYSLIASLQFDHTFFPYFFISYWYNSVWYLSPITAEWPNSHTCTHKILFTTCKRSTKWLFFTFGLFFIRNRITLLARKVGH